MRARWIALSCLLTAGCPGGSSVLQLTVTSNATVDGVQRLHVQMTDVAHARPAQPIDLPLAGAPVSIPPTQSFALVLPRGTSGKLHVEVDALDISGHQIAAGVADVSVVAGSSMPFTVTLGGGVSSGDMASLADMAPPPGADLTAALADLAPPGLPVSCADVKAAHPGAVDGFYTLYLAGNALRPWSAYCKGMAATPSEYLPLRNTGSANFANSVDPNNSVTTSYFRVRIDPVKLLVDINDVTFASSIGKQGSATAWPYGTAGCCILNGTRGVSNIDLRGTPFAVAPTQFVSDGSNFIGNPNVAAAYSANNQVVVLQANGDCGWTVPRPDFAPAQPGAPDFHLQLYYQLPMTCAEVKRQNPSAADGNYTLFVDGDAAEPWIAFCHGMDSIPAEFLVLPNTAAGQNYSLLNDGAGNTVTTSYTRLRVDGTHLLVDVDDRTFATSTGTSGTTSAMPYGTAEGCTIGSNFGKLDVDLRGTPFAIPVGTFANGGNNPTGGATATNNNQTIDATMSPSAGSGCAFVEAAPVVNDPRATVPLAGYHLPLAYAPVTCAQIKALGAGAGDGLYTLFVGGDSLRQWPAYCAGMAGTPAEYLPLPPPTSVSTKVNFAQLISAGQTVETTFNRVRINPTTLQVDISDKTFATSTGMASANGHAIASVSFGVAASCDSATTAKAQVSTAGTYMTVSLPNQWVTGGVGPTGSASYASGYSIAITGSGSGGCNWTVPAPVFDPTATGGTFQLLMVR
jgi:hypothetical protein